VPVRDTAVVPCRDNELLSVSCSSTSVFAGAIEHPLHAELVCETAEIRAPERSLQRHLDFSVNRLQISQMQAVAAMSFAASTSRLSRAAFWRRLERVVGTQLLVQELGREVGAIGSEDGAKFFVQRKCHELRLFLQELEDLAPQLGFKIHFTFRAICEPQPDSVLSTVFGFSQFWQHWHHSSGTIRFRAFRSGFDHLNAYNVRGASSMLAV
jgi:hypothetical protein